MKKLVIALFIISLAAPAAWGLYSTRERVPEKAQPIVKPSIASPESRPLMVTLDRFNDWAVSLKHRLKAYLYRDQRAAMESWSQKCLPRIGEGLYARAERVRGDGITAVAGQIFNVSGSNRAPAAYRLKLYDHAGTLIGTGETRVDEIKAHTVQAFRAVLRVPGRRVARIAVELDAVTSHYCGFPQRVVSLLK